MHLDIVQHIGPGLFTYGSSASQNANNAMMLEYVGHGTVRSAVIRFIQKRCRIPERMIWGIFLCCRFGSPPPPSLPPTHIYR